MPVLNPAVLTDVLTECLKTANDSRKLGKFLLSGREPLHAALNYFKKAKCVEVLQDRMKIYVNTGGVNHKHEISYQFSLINLIMNTIAPKLDEIIISGYPRHFKAIEYFLEHKIKKVQAFQNLPLKYQQLLALSDFIEKVTIYLCGGATAMNMIPDSCRELKFKFATFEGIEINQIMKRHKEWLKNIEKLGIEATTFGQKRSISALSLDPFPMLQSIDFISTYEDEMKYVIEMFKDTELKFLKRFANSNVTGNMIFKNRISPNSRKVIPSFEQVLQQIKDIPGVTSDEEEQTIVRTVELKENLVVEFILVFDVDYDYYENL